MVGSGLLYFVAFAVMYAAGYVYYKWIKKVLK
jgi:hypothetical protein